MDAACDTCPLLHHFPYQGGRDDTILVCDRVNRVDNIFQRFSEFSQVCDIPLAVVSEGKIVAHQQMAESQLLGKGFHESACSCGGKLAVKMLQDDMVDTLGQDQFTSFLDRGKPFESFLLAEGLCRVRVKGQHRGWCSFCPGAFAEHVQHCLVPDMDTIKNPDGQPSALQVKIVN